MYNIIINVNTFLPFDILNLILEYDGRIKYVHKERIYVNINKKLYHIKQFCIEKHNLKYYVILIIETMKCILE
jgi:hypothetical protein